MKQAEIAAAAAAELPALAAIERAAARIFSPADVPPPMAESTVAMATLEAARADGRLWVARVDGRAVGFLVAGFLGDEPFVIEVDVLPELQRRGIGTALLRAAADWARARGAAGLVLTTFRHVPWNAPFYERLGFAEIPPEEQGPEIRARLVEETSLGLDPGKRVAMRLRLAPG